MNTNLKLFIAAIVGASLWAGFTQIIVDEKPAVKQPLYWVAPMDSNYRRDAPGLSPMGMDLVPVYDEVGNSESEKGAITISPVVINNLGVKTTKVQLKTLQSNINTQPLLMP